MTQYGEGDLAAEGKEHKFCYLYWEHGPGSGQASLYYLDTPNPLGEPAHRIFPSKGDFRDFVSRLKEAGWKVYGMNANQEAYESWLLQLPAPEKGYEYCVFSYSVALDEHGQETVRRRKDLYELNDSNQSVMPGDNYRYTYDNALQYLKQEQWEFAYEEDYPAFTSSPNQRLRLRFFKRPVTGSSAAP